jgi:hypothetical protein
MRTETVEYKVYSYGELSDDAKEKAKEWFLEGRESFMFTEDCEQDLENLFGKNSLKVQYSLGYCQGDGLNIHGKISAEAILNCLEAHNGGTQLEQFEDVLTDKEKKTILHYAKQCGEIELPINSHYCYCISDYVDIAEEWSYILENYFSYSNINKETLEKFEGLVKGIFTTLCEAYEKWGYEYFYEFPEEDMEDICEANGYEFLEDGTIF